MADERTDSPGVGEWLELAGSLGALLLGAAVMLSSVLEGPVVVGYLLVGPLPFALGLLGFSRALPARERGAADGEALLDELERRYATGELEDEWLERQVEARLEAEHGGRRDDERAGELARH